MALIRMAAPGDAGAMLAVYAPYILETAITFEYQVPAEEEFRGRVEEILRRHPWLLAEEEGKVLGYAYAAPYRSRAAYQWDAEGSVYLAREARGRGLGTALYRCLMELLEAQGMRNFYGCITHPNPASEALHRALGFREAGVLPRSGYKLGRWWDVLWMERPLGSGDEEPRPPVPLGLLPEEKVAEALARANAALAEGKGGV